MKCVLTEPGSQAKTRRQDGHSSGRAELIAGTPASLAQVFNAQMQGFQKLLLPVIWSMHDLITCFALSSLRQTSYLLS